MAVSKRTRFEVFKRDDHTCRYCGQSAPDIRVTIDHVTPTALGGDDKPSNLVTACMDCNAGKASTVPDSATVEQVSDAALRYAQLVRSAWSIAVQDVSRRDDWVCEVEESIHFPVPNDYRASLGRFCALGVPIEIAVEAAEIAASKYDPFGNSDKFKYMCGILWKKVEEIGSAVRESLDLDGNWYDEETLTNIRIDAYDQGWEAGRTQGFHRGLMSPTFTDRLLLHAVEGTYPRTFDFHMGHPEHREAWRAAPCG